MSYWLPARRTVRGAVNPTIAWQPTDQDGNPADLGDSSGDVTVAVTTSDGTAVSGVGTVDGFGTDGERTATLPASAVASIEWLDVAWTYGGNVLHEETVEVVGGTIGSHAELIEHGGSLTESNRDVIRTARLAIEDIATQVMNRSPFRRLCREKVDGSGTGTQIVTWPDVAELVWARYWNGSSWVAFTSAEIAACQGDDAGMIHRIDGNVWPSGRQNIEVGYRFGWSSIPHDLGVELHRAVRHKVGQIRTASAPMERATSMSTFDGMNYVIVATPGTYGWSTGLPDTDDKLNRYKFARIGVA